MKTFGYAQMTAARPERSSRRCKTETPATHEKQRVLASAETIPGSGGGAQGYLSRYRSELPTGAQIGSAARRRTRVGHARCRSPRGHDDDLPPTTEG
jgi:hypothetical protein